MTLSVPEPLAIVSTEHFVKKLLTDCMSVGTTVSVPARILKQAATVGRHKGGASLIRAGEEFLRPAPTFVQLWQRVRHQAGCTA